MQQEHPASWLNEIKSFNELKKTYPYICFSASQEAIGIEACFYWTKAAAREAIAKTLITSHASYPPNIKKLIIDPRTSWEFEKIFCYIYELIKQDPTFSLDIDFPKETPVDGEHVVKTIELIFPRQVIKNLSQKITSSQHTGISFSLWTSLGLRPIIFRTTLLHPPLQKLLIEDAEYAYRHLKMFDPIDLMSALSPTGTSGYFCFINSDSPEILTFKNHRVVAPDEKTDLTGKSLLEVLVSKIRQAQKPPLIEKNGQLEPLEDLIQANIAQLDTEIKALSQEADAYNTKLEIYPSLVAQVSSVMELKAKLLEDKDPTGEITQRIKGKYITMIAASINTVKEKNSNKKLVYYRDQVSKHLNDIKKKQEEKTHWETVLTALTKAHGKQPEIKPSAPTKNLSAATTTPSPLVACSMIRTGVSPPKESDDKILSNGL